MQQIVFLVYREMIVHVPEDPEILPDNVGSGAWLPDRLFCDTTFFNDHDSLRFSQGLQLLKLVAGVVKLTHVGSRAAELDIRLDFR